MRLRSSQPRVRIGTAAARMPVPSLLQRAVRKVCEPSRVSTSQSPIGRRVGLSASRSAAIAPIRSR